MIAVEQGRGARVLVTGAAGFVGGPVGRELARRGHRVVGLFRGAPSIDWPGECARAADLLDRPAIARALAGVDAVVHLAARVHVMRETVADPAAEFQRVNVDGTALLLEEAERAGVRHFVFGSSVKAVGEGGEEPLSESTSPAPGDPYGESKLQAEALVRDFGNRSGRVATSVRFPLVYGPGVRANMLRLFDLVARGVPLPFGGVRNRRSLLYVENAAAAIAAILSAPTPAGPLYMLSDGEDVSSAELVRRIGRALGRAARLAPVPPWVFRAAGSGGDVVAKLVPWPLTTAAVRRLTGSLVVDSSRIRRELGFEPPFHLQQGLEATASWYRARRVVA